MICRDSLLWRNVTEHSFLLVVVAAHSLVSLAFLTSDEFFELKLQRKWVFQQTARAEAPETADRSAPLAAEIQDMEGSKKKDRILIVEDDRTITHVVKYFLEL